VFRARAGVPGSGASLESINVSQSSITAGALVIAWIIFITVRGELPKYFGALGIGPQAETAAPGSGGGGAPAVSVSPTGVTVGIEPQQAPIPDWGRVASPWGGGGPGAIQNPWEPSLPL
jgi:hypothetical protein